jgi:ParB/RepB/Spo0J family partition protein
MQTKLEHIALVQITTSATNEMFRDPAELTNEGLKDLIDSVISKGIIQPVLLRPLKDSPFKYELICGERRFHAAGFANLDTIPANIREMTDEEAFECQVTENLQRKDIHPLKEAKAYKYLVDKDPVTYTVKELALKFGKSEHYIATRLKLNELVPEIRKDYLAGKMSLAAAVIIARLDPADQKEVKEDCGGYGGGDYDTVDDIEDFIERSVMCNLKEAPFKKDDASLNPSMGACTTCQFRTGANQLFADMKDKDRCLNKACFQLKRLAHTLNILSDTIDNKPDILILQTRNDVLEGIDKYLKTRDIKPLKEYSDFYTYDNGGTKAKGLWISGPDAGKFETVYIPKKSAGKIASAKAGSSSNEQTKLENDIERIEVKLAKDREKADGTIYKKVLEAVVIHDHQKTVGIAITPGEDALFMMYIYEQVQYAALNDDGDLLPEWKKLKLPVFDDAEMGEEKDWEKLYKQLTVLTAEQRAFLCRQFLALKFYTNKYPDEGSMSALFITRAAADLGVPVAMIRQEQADMLKANEEKALSRIKQLKGNLKELQKEPKTKKKKVAETA